MPNKRFMMTLDDDLLNRLKEIAWERSFKEKKDYTYQDILRKIIKDLIKNEYKDEYNVRT